MKIREIRVVARYLRRGARLAIGRVVLIRSREPAGGSVALNDVVLLDPEDTMAEVKERAAQIARFREKGLLTTRYDIRFADGDLEALYEDSALFGELWVLSQQGRGKEGYLFDDARVRMGVITLTPKGRGLFGVPEPGAIRF